MNEEGMERLRSAVVLRAVKDLRGACRRLRHFPDDRLAQKRVREISAFFCSGHFALFTSLDGPALLRELIEEMEER